MGHALSKQPWVFRLLAIQSSLEGRLISKAICRPKSHSSPRTHQPSRAIQAIPTNPRISRHISWLVVSKIFSESQKSKSGPPEKITGPHFLVSRLPVSSPSQIGGWSAPKLILEAKNQVRRDGNNSSSRNSWLIGNRDCSQGQTPGWSSPKLILEA